MRTIKDEELRAYADRIGYEKYRNEYGKLYCYASNNQNVRYSKTRNTHIDLEKIKEKYKNGIPSGTIELMVGLKEE